MKKKRPNWIHTFYNFKRNQLLIVVAPRGDEKKKKYKKLQWLGSTSGNERKINIHTGVSIEF